MPEQMKSVDEVVAMLDGLVQAYVESPADTDYHDGYLAALEEVRRRVSGKPSRRIRRVLHSSAD